VPDGGRPSRHFVVGVIIVALGFIFLLGELGFVEANRIFLLWPLILIYFGINKLFSHRSMVTAFWGGFLILLGVSFQLEELGMSHVHLGTIWPVFMICLGVLLILQRYENRKFPPYSDPQGPPPIPPPPLGTTPGPADIPSNVPPAGAGPQTQSNFANNFGPGSSEWNRSWSKFGKHMENFGERMHDAGGWYDSSEPRLNDVNIFWGGRRRIVTKNFTGGEIVTIFGGFDLDLREADIQGNEAQIEVVTIFGGGDIRVPANWNIVMETVGIFGGCGDRTRHPDPPAPGATAVPPQKKLTIKGVAIFGGMNVKN